MLSGIIKLERYSHPSIKIINFTDGTYFDRNTVESFGARLVWISLTLV